MVSARNSANEAKAQTTEKATGGIVAHLARSLGRQGLWRIGPAREGVFGLRSSLRPLFCLNPPVHARALT
jgi:hypothetical protein